MKKRVGLIGVILLFMLVATGLYTWYRTPDSYSLVLNNYSHKVKVLRDAEELRQGLSGTKDLPKGSAVLFVFASDNEWGIWMKDMNYPIDIVWLDSSARVVHTVRNAQPASYPDTTFTPPVKARYVIELPSGTIEQTDIKNGDRAELPSGV